MTDLGGCWGWGKHSFFPWRWVKKRQRHERKSSRCNTVETATADEFEGVH